MRWIPVLTVVLAVAVPAAAQEAATEQRALLARIAMEAQLRIGDILHEKGDRAGALEAYQEAVRIYAEAIGVAPARTPAKDGTAGKDGLVDAEPKKRIDFTKPQFGEDGVKLLPGVAKGAGAALRGRGGRRNLRAGGGSGLTENAVELGLQWLADHQDVEGDGRWDTDDYMKHDPADDVCDGPGMALHDVGSTSLAVLAFLGAGYIDRGSARENKYAKNVRMGLRYLMQSQDAEGVFGTRAHYGFIYHHALATLAMSEAYWMTRNPRYKKPAQAAANWLLAGRNPGLGWRYGKRSGENDTSVTTLCVMALKSAQMAGLEVDPGAFEGALTWIDKMTDREFGQVGYNFRGGAPARPEGLQDKFPPEKSQSMTAAGIFTRVMCGENPRTSAAIQKGARLCAEVPPAWNPDDGSIDMYYWYLGTMAMFQVGGRPWRDWNQAMKGAIVKNQHLKGSGSRTGSWDPIGVWGGMGGRVYATALMTMSLEVYYRYQRVFGAK